MKIYTFPHVTTELNQSSVSNSTVNDNLFQKITNNKNFYFIDNIISSSKYMGELANIKYENNQFENLTTFEPFYIKDFFIVNKNK